MNRIQNKTTTDSSQDNQLSIYINENFKSELIGSQELRVIGTSDSPLFIAKDIASMLGYKDTKRATQLHIDDDDKLTYKQVKKSGGTNHPSLKIQPQTILINESGLYSLILRSNKEIAKKFKRWVTSEVLPSIRKTGQYKIEEL